MTHTHTHNRENAVTPSGTQGQKCQGRESQWTTETPDPVPQCFVRMFQRRAGERDRESRKAEDIERTEEGQGCSATSAAADEVDREDVRTDARVFAVLDDGCNLACHTPAVIGWFGRRAEEGSSENASGDWDTPSLQWNWWMRSHRQVQHYFRALAEGTPRL